MRFLMLNWRDPQNPLAGGAERVSLAFMRGLVARGHEVSWFAFDFPAAARTEVIAGIQFIRGGGKFTAVAQARRWCQRRPRFDLVIDQHHGIPWYAPWWCGTNCISYIHEVLGPIWNSFYGWPLNWIGRWQEQWTHRCYAGQTFWTPSESTRRDLEHHGVRRVKVLPNGCDTAPLAALPAKPLRTPLQLITVCRLAANKRVEHALRAVQLLRQQGVPVQLTIVGRGESEASLRSLVAQWQLGTAVEFAGGLPEAEKNLRLQQAHLLVHSSVREGWGLNVIEANAMGTPALVYPVAGLVDSTINQETGWVTSDESPAALASQIRQLVTDEATYQRCRHRAWERAGQFQWPGVLDQTCTWLEQQARTPRADQQG